jgi:hypothetical protein
MIIGQHNMLKEGRFLGPLFSCSLRSLAAFAALIFPRCDPDLLERVTSPRYDTRHGET